MAMKLPPSSSLVFVWFGFWFDRKQVWVNQNIKILVPSNYLYLACSSGELDLFVTIIYLYSLGGFDCVVLTGLRQITLVIP